jgi:sulfhydrogenase subunit gamma (sulfur reductase)
MAEGMDGMSNPYMPYPVRIDGITIENDERDLKTFKLVFLDPEHADAFDHTPGQFAELSVLGKGECPIGIASSPTEKGFLLFTVKKTGVVTDELHRSREGRVIGVRGPLGNAFPIERMKGKNLVVVGGGFAFTTLRALIRYVIDDEHRADFGDLTVIYGARNPGELLYKSELDEWRSRDDLDAHITVDKGDETWTGHEGFVPTILGEVAPSAQEAMIVVCGPPVMIKFTLPVIEQLGFAPTDTILSLEMRMKCGIGKCGRCNIGSKYVCKDGPVFTLEQLSALPAEF